MAHTFKNGIYDFLGSSETLNINGQSIKIELDYEWDYVSDPIITPTIVHEWSYLNELFSKYVLYNAKSVLSIGGGGSSKTHEYLSPGTEEFIILNPGKWDLEYAKLPERNITTYKILAIAEQIPLFSNQVDAIEIPATLDHVVDARKVIQESFRVLVEGGKIGITLGNSASWYRKLVDFLRVKVTDNHEHHHNFHFTVEEVENLLWNEGFVEVKTRGTAYLKLPKKIERRINSPALLFLHRFVSNTLLRLIFGDAHGGMFLTYAVKPPMLL